MDPGGGQPSDGINDGEVIFPGPIGAKHVYPALCTSIKILNLININTNIKH